MAVAERWRMENGRLRMAGALNSKNNQKVRMSLAANDIRAKSLVANVHFLEKAIGWEWYDGEWTREGGWQIAGSKAIQGYLRFAIYDLRGRWRNSDGPMRSDIHRWEYGGGLVARRHGQGGFRLR
jgi:hypothetical protein